jgi:hypothetical protein
MDGAGPWGRGPESFGRKKPSLGSASSRGAEKQHHLSTPPSRGGAGGGGIGSRCSEQLGPEQGSGLSGWPGFAGALACSPWGVWWPRVT